MTDCPNPVTCPFTDDNEPHSVDDHPKVTRPENADMNQSLGAALWQWGRHRELPESADAIFEAAEMVYAALNGDAADLIAVVRRGVESGTIKGEVVDCSTCEGSGEWRRLNGVVDCPDCVGGRVLVIPVSDGGSET